MRGLSKRAWNNILIFAMLGLIVVFNFDRLFPVDSSNRAMLIAEHEFILSMQINELTFERIGTGWRVSAPSLDSIPDMQSESIDKLVNQWQKVKLIRSSDSLEPNLTSSPPYIVSVWLAGQEEAKVVGLLEVDNIPYVIHKGDLFVLDEPSFFDLLPPTSGGFDNK